MWGMGLFWKIEGIELAARNLVNKSTSPQDLSSATHGRQLILTSVQVWKP